MTFEDYLRSQSPAIDFAIRVDFSGGDPAFYVHPAKVDGATVDFRIKGNRLIPVPQVPDSLDACVDGPIDILKHPLLGECFELIGLIEACGASAEVTNASVKAVSVMSGIEKLRAEIESLRNDDMPF